MKVVKILWEDSCNSNLSWVTKEDVEVELVNIDSFGVVVKETDEFVSIAQNYGSEPEQFSNIVTIPRGCIKEIFVIHDDNYVRQCEQKPADKVEPKKLKKIEKKPTETTDFRTWKYIVDAVLTEREDIGQYIDNPWTTKVAEKLQKRFGNIEQKPAWSEEDDSCIRIIIQDLERIVENKNAPKEQIIDILYNEIKWLKSLKDRVLPQQKPIEWNKEDENHIQSSVYGNQLPNRKI